MVPLDDVLDALERLMPLLSAADLDALLDAISVRYRGYLPALPVALDNSPMLSQKHQQPR